MYVTPTQLADGSDATRELAELYGVDAELMAAVIAGGDTSAWEPEQVDAAEQALMSIDRYCEHATAEVDARLRQRGYVLPADPVRFPVLVVWSRAIARYHLNRNRDKTDEERGRIERDYRDALRALQLVAEGRLSLGADDPLAGAPGSGAVMATGADRIFSRRTLGRL